MDRRKIIPVLVVGALMIASIVGVGIFNSVKAAAPVASNVVTGNFNKGFGGGGATSDSDLAAALGITAEQLQTAYTTARDEALSQAVTAGLITQAQADQVKANGAKDFGFGHLNIGTIDTNALLAKALGISVDKLQAAYQTAYNASIDRAVTNGNLTKDQADMMKARYALQNSSKFQTAMQSAFTAAVNQAVTDGLISQAQADQIIKDSTSGYGMGRDFEGFGGMRGGPGMGRGMGPGGFGEGGRHGGRGFDNQGANPTAPTTPTATPSGT